MNVTKQRQTADRKRRYISTAVDIYKIIELAELHRNTPELARLVNFGLKPKTISKLGFGVPLTTAGPQKDLPDPIRYLNKILELYSKKLEFVRQEQNQRVRSNVYRVVDWDAADFGSSSN